MSLSPGSSNESPKTSPRGSENLKPGFKKVGLHPSERVVSDEGERKKESLSASLARQEEELKDVSVPHGLDTALQASEVKSPQGLAKPVVEESLPTAKDEQSNDIVPDEIAKALKTSEENNEGTKDTQVQEVVPDTAGALPIGEDAAAASIYGTAIANPTPGTQSVLEEGELTIIYSVLMATNLTRYANRLRHRH